MGKRPANDNNRRCPPPIGPNELRLMNSRAREMLLKYCDLPLFESLLKKHGLALKGSSVLDAGCGSGYSLQLILHKFEPEELVGFDIVPSQVEIARSRGTKATVLTADITALDLPSQRFDAAFVCGVLHHCSDWRTGLAEIARVLKDGGLLLMEEPGTLHLKFERLLTRNSEVLDSGFSARRLAMETVKNGLTIVDSRHLYFGLFRSYLCVKGAAVRAPQHFSARKLLRTQVSSSVAPGQEAPA